MGDPKKPRKTYSRPKNPWRSEQLAQELYLVGTYGLRNKRELWKTQGELSNVRKQARHLLAASTDVRTKEGKKLLDSLSRRGLVPEGVALDDVLNLSVEDFLSRRLQTLVYKKGAAVSPLQARQLIVHGHIKLGARFITIPGYMVTAAEEGSIQVIGGIGTPKTAAPAAPAAQAAAAPAPKPEQAVAPPAAA
ncbi:MAG TPA: 30S ribosomal protein S4 [Nitrososphaerales archaeon]|nr:30S ribosomal protein S4 [Nitrososphaerales archaeon]HUK74521.1 30S ribosomal protein S4 [Nitrososphaerales archaeon]